MTFADFYSSAHMRVPNADILLVREWALDVYREACDEKGWSHQRVETAISCNVQKTGTCTTVKGSATVTAGTMVFAATDVGRQIRLTSIPIYTIIAVADNLLSVTLDRTYSESSATSTFTVLDAYWTAPLDFWRFIAVLDPLNKWRLRWWITEQQLNQRDPGRQSTGSAWALVSQRYSPVVADAGKVRFELWPYITTERSYVVMYYQKPDELADDTTIIGPFARARSVLVDGVLAKAALWPGTAAVRNPYFNLGLADRLDAKFRNGLELIVMKDEELYPTSMPMAEYEWAPGPWDSNWLQGHVPYTIESSAYY